ncbi:MAG TPA: ribonuclease PH [Dehalococcoidia bacterium]|nr:ribonuclease PH [Dehalococcoidia bacterium]
MKRVDGRVNNEMRPVKITMGYLTYPEGSTLIEIGNTRVLCTVSIEDRVPLFLKGEGTGWLTAEYAMLPRSTHTRTQRSVYGDKVAGRTQEIQRLIGRSLRVCIDLTAIGERTITIDCDVLQADGGTRTASITGGYLALAQGLRKLKSRGILKTVPLKCAVAATSVGIVDGDELLDLCYAEDFRAAVDFNVVMTDKGDFVEIQGTAESKPFSRKSADSLLTLADKGIKELLAIQKKVLE